MKIDNWINKVVYEYLELMIGKTCLITANLNRLSSGYKECFLFAGCISEKTTLPRIHLVVIPNNNKYLIFILLTKFNLEKNKIKNMVKKQKKQKPSL